MQIAIGTCKLQSGHGMRAHVIACMAGEETDGITSQAKTKKRLFLNKKYFDCRIPGLILLKHLETIS
jgi:hypothetical protein